MKGFRTKRALAFVMALVLSFSTFASDFASITSYATEIDVNGGVSEEKAAEMTDGSIVDENEVILSAEKLENLTEEIETEIIEEKTLDESEELLFEEETALKSIKEPEKTEGVQMLLDAKKPKTYTVTFDLNGGTFVSNNHDDFTKSDVAKDTKINSLLPKNEGKNEFTREGYDFQGWSLSKENGPLVPDDYKVTKNVTVYAKWQHQTYTIKYDLNCGSYNYKNFKSVGPQECEVNKDYNLASHTADSSFSRSGYTFTGWNTADDGTGTHYADRAKVNNLATANGEITLYAEWQPIEYTITYNKYDSYIRGTASGSVSSQNAKNNESVFLSKDSFSCDKGYVQVGWEGPISGEYYDFGEEYTVTGNVRMDAHWVQSGDYYIVYHLSENSDVESHYMYSVRDTYYSNDTVLNKYSDVSDFYMPRSSTKWNISGKEFTCWKDANGVECKPGETIDLVSLYKGAEYEPYGYYVIDLYGQWEDAAPETYTITYDVNGAEGSVEPQTCNMNETAILSDAEGLSKTGYDFAGWTCDGKTFVAGENVDAFNEDVTLIAQWTPIRYYLHYVANGGIGTEVSAGLVAYDEKTTLKLASEVEFENPGYKLVGWSDKNEKVYNLGQQDVVLNLTTEDYAGKDDNTDNAEKLYAEWEIENYKLTFYKEDGVTEISSNDFTVESDTFTSNVTAPSVEKKRFLGWQEITNADSSNDLVQNVTIEKGSIGNRSFKAVYENKNLSASFTNIDAYWLGENYSIVEPTVYDASTKEVVEASFTYNGEATNSFGLGKQTVKVVVSADDYNDFEANVVVDVHYYVLRENEAPVAKFTGATGKTIDGKEWYGSLTKENTITLSFDGFKVSKTNDKEYGFKDSIDISAEPERQHDYEAFLIKLDGSKEVGIVGDAPYGNKYMAKGTYYIDKTAPNTDIEIDYTSVQKVLQTLTFGKFYINTKTACISAIDNLTGVETVKYALSDALASDYSALEWKDYSDEDGVKLDANFKGIVYAKATDKVGNETIVYSDGIVVYKAVGDVDTTKVTYTKTTKSDVEISGTSNGNTIKSVIVTDSKNNDYSVNREEVDTEDGKFAFKFKGESLENLPAGEYTVTIVFNCYDVDGGFSNNQTKSVKLTVNKADTSLDISANDWVFDQYNNNIKDLVVKNIPKNGEAIANPSVNLSYAKKGTENFVALPSNYNDIIPGEYVLKASYAGDATYNASEKTVEFTVLTPEVYYYVRRSNGYNTTWTEMDHVVAGVLSADAFNVYFANGKVGTLEGQGVATVSDTFANASSVIDDLKANGYEVSIHKIGLFDKTNNDVDHRDAFKHFHVDFDLSKITDETVSVSMENWTYGDVAKNPVATQNTTEPNTKTEKRGGKQTVSYWYTGTIRGEGNESYRQYSSAQVPTQAGTYTVTATFAANDFYNETKATDTFTIAPKVVEVDWKLDGEDKKSVVYDGNSHHVFGVVTNEVYRGENFYVNPIWSENDKTDAGTYKSKAWEVVDSFGFRTYNYTFADEEAFTWTIEQKEVTMHWPSNASFTYNGYDQGYYLPGYENVMFGLDWIGLDGIVKSDEYKVYPELKGSSLRNTNAGTYHVEATGDILGERGGNYKLGGFGSHKEWVQTGFLPWMGYNKTVQDVPHFDWTIGQLEAVLSWSGSDTANHSDKDFKFTYSELPYTVSATVTNVQAKDTVTVSEYAKDGYGWNAEPSNKKTYVGKYKAVATKLDNPNYKLPTNASQQFSIDWLIADDATLTGTLGNNGWYRSSVTLSKEDFEIREVTAKTYSTVYVTKWNNSIQKNSETAGANIEYQLKNSEGYITNYKNVGYKIDKSAPTGDVYIGFSSILNNKVFKWFFKDQVFVGVNANDNTSWVGANSGIDKIEYQLSGEKEFKTYNKYWGITIPANTKTDVLVKITDNAGNVKVLANSDDIIVYTDSEADTENVDYIKTSFEEKAVAVKLNDNTIKAVKNLTTDDVLSKEDYDISGNEIVLKGAYLDSLDAKENSSADKSSKEYEFAVSYNPYDETFTAYNPYARYFDFRKWDWVNNTDSLGFDANDTYFTVNVYKNAEEQVTINALDKTYDGAPVAATFTTVSGRNAVSDNDKFVVEYRANVADQADDAGWSTNAPVGAGSYQVKVTALEDENYYEASAIRDFTIARRHVDVYANDASKMQGDADPTLTVSVDNAIEGVTAYPWRDSGETPGEYTIHTNVQGDYPNYDVESHQGTFTIAANPALAVLPPAATPTFTPVGPTQVAEVEAEEVEEVVEENPEEVEVPEEETPLAEAPSEEVEIAEEAVPEAAATCIMHWITLGIAVLYAAYALVRALQNKEELDGEEKTAEN